MKLLLLLLIAGFSPNPNPIRLDSQGQIPALYLQPHKTYRLILFAPVLPGDHFVTMCNGVQVGRQLWLMDDLVSLEPLPHGRQEALSIKSLFLDNGKPAAGAYLCSYKSGTTIPQYTLHRD